jgi:hypothetical protein
MWADTELRNKYIELDRHIQEVQSGCRALTKIEFGEHLANDSGLNTCDLNEDTQIVIILPKEIMAVNSSFLYGLFKKLVGKYGLEAFNSKVSLVSTKKSFQDSLDTVKLEALNRITRTIEHFL